MVFGLYITQIANLKKNMLELGWGIVTTLAFTLILAFTIYIFVAQKELHKYTGRKVSVFGKKMKLMMIICCFLAGLLAIYTWVSPYSWPNQVAAINKTKDDAPPTFPDPAGIIDPPTEKQVDSSPVIPAKNVNLLYRNISGVKLTLLVYDWYYHYHPINQPFAPKTAWRRLHFSEDESYKTLSNFTRSTGWYSFYVEENETGKQHQCDTKNIFYSEWPTLTVKSSANKEHQFTIEFSTEDQP